MRRLVGSVTVGLAALVGCSQPARLDVDRAEEDIRARLAESWAVEVGAVTCPDEIEVEVGASTTCRVVVAGARVDVVVRQTDDEGGVAVAPRRAVLVADRVAEDITGVLADRFERADATVECPGPEVRVADPGSGFTCTAVDGEERREVEVRVRDARGALTYSLGGTEGG